MAEKELNLTKFAIKVTLKIDILVEFEICLCFSLLFLSIFLFTWIFNYLIINVIDDILLIRYPYCFSKICKESSNRKSQNFRDTQCAANMKRLGKKKMKTVRCPLLQVICIQEFKEFCSSQILLTSWTSKNKTSNISHVYKIHQLDIF